MAFRPLARTTARWRPAGGEGLEHLDLSATRDGVRARSVVIGERGGAPYGVSYEIACDAGWRVRSFEIEATCGRSLALRSAVAGRWTDAAGHARPDLEGCIDIDLSGTPFTNTLPIRRLGLAPADGPTDLSMLYVPFDTFEPVRDGQRYTAIDARTVRYEAMDRSFSAELPLDEDALVLDYPTLFQRV